MRQEKQYIRDEYLARLKSSPFFIVVDYRSLKVHQFTELRKRLRQVGSELRVVKNSIFRIAAHEAQLADLKGSLSGQVAVVTGQQDVSAAAKVVKTAIWLLEGSASGSSRCSGPGRFAVDRSVEGEIGWADSSPRHAFGCGAERSRFPACARDQGPFRSGRVSLNPRGISHRQSNLFHRRHGGTRQQQQTTK